MPADFSFFYRPDTLLVFTTAPTGFGHIRVTLALKDALPPDIPVHLIGLHDPSFEISYSLQSRSPILRYVAESVQNHRILENVFSFGYRNLLYFSSQHTYAILAKLIKKQTTPPKTLIVVATHFSLAHQIAHCKSQLETDFHLKLILNVVVTDDSPQHIWAVPNADYIFVPSLTTANEINRYLSTITNHPPQVLISPYPLSPILSKPLTSTELENRQSQVGPRSHFPTQIMIPVSGAAVQIPYLHYLIEVLITNPSLALTVVSRESSYCNPFLAWCGKFPQIRVLSSNEDEQVVRLYTQAYAENVYVLEVTKPSEQSFKALLPPNTRGGTILLFSPPVGRQEVDNLNFLDRHHLLFNPNTDPRPTRALLLSENGQAAGLQILSLLPSDVFSHMINFSGYLEHPELKSNGSEHFWSTLTSLIY